MSLAREAPLRGASRMLKARLSSTSTMSIRIACSTLKRMP